MEPCRLRLIGLPEANATPQLKDEIMADKHPSGNPDLIEQHKKIQQKGDREISQGTSAPDPDSPVPGKGKPDKQEGVGTVQNQKR